MKSFAIGLAVIGCMLVGCGNASSGFEGSQGAAASTTTISLDSASSDSVPARLYTVFANSGARDLTVSDAEHSVSCYEYSLGLLAEEAYHCDIDFGKTNSIRSKDSPKSLAEHLWLRLSEGFELGHGDVKLDDDGSLSIGDDQGTFRCQAAAVTYSCKYTAASR
jgi:hypothetical protein